MGDMVDKLVLPRCAQRRTGCGWRGKPQFY